MESLVVIGIMTMLLLVVTQIFALNYDIYEKQTRRTDNEIGAILAVRTVSEMARGATAVLASRSINGTVYTSSKDALVLEMPTVDANGDIVAGSFDYTAIYRDGVETAKIFSDTEASASSVRRSGKRLATGFNAVAIFRYNHPDVADADRVSVYLVNRQVRRGTTLVTKAWASIFLRN